MGFKVVELGKGESGNSLQSSWCERGLNYIALRGVFRQDLESEVEENCSPGPQQMALLRDGGHRASR